MDKEKVITIVIGLLIGLLAAGGYFFFFKDFKFTQSPKPPKIQNKQPVNATSSPSANFSWDIPQNLMITSGKTASVSGTANPGSKIIILSNADQDSLEVGSDGKFSTQINLEEGENKIGLTYLDKDKPPVTLVRQIFLEI